MRKFTTTLYLSDKTCAEIERLAQDWCVDADTAVDMIAQRALYAHVIRNIAAYRLALDKGRKKGT